MAVECMLNFTRRPKTVCFFNGLSFQVVVRRLDWFGFCFAAFVSLFFIAVYFCTLFPHSVEIFLSDFSISMVCFRLLVGVILHGGL